MLYYVHSDGELINLTQKRQQEDLNSRTCEGPMLGLEFDDSNNIVSSRGNISYSGKRPAHRGVSWWTNTRSPTCRFRVGLSHLSLCWRVWRYSRLHRFHTRWEKAWMSCHCDSRLSGVSARFSSGVAVSGAPIKKWPGVNTCKSFGSLDRAVSGREFSIASTWQVSVMNWLRVGT